MSIVNSTFNNYPIEFKEINPEDFTKRFSLDGSTTIRNSFTIENNGNKIIINPNNDGYINEPLQENIDIKNKNTVVINASVGQGKSYSIIKTIKRYYEDNSPQKYVIIVASPFVSLVKQYVNDIHNDGGIPKEEIFDYNVIGRTPDRSYLTKSVHVVTVNTLLGNPGEDGFKNSEAKREYLTSLSKHCEQNNVKVVFIYDEIHDSYYNFKQEYIFNLWKWKKVIHKNFIISATFNEASKIIIEYLAELTDRKIKIIESKRKIFPKKQSKLHLHYSDDYNFTTNTKEIKNIIVELVRKKKNIDILCYSKSLSKDIINPKGDIGKELRRAYGINQIKDCTSQLASNSREENIEQQNQYDNSMCNVGTNFKTGVSIKKDNHAFIIIMPPRSTRLHFKNQYGIFSGGINSVIQALARQRTKGDIHIILSKPDKFNYNTLVHANMNDEQLKQFKTLYDIVEYYAVDKKVDYLKLNRQHLYLNKFYQQELSGYLQNEINTISNTSRNDLPPLKFPKLETFILDNGEDYLANRYKIFGEDISAYLTYASITNQFTNCRLENIFARKNIIFSEDKVFQELNNFVKKEKFEERLALFKGWGTFNRYYEEFKATLYKNYNVLFKKTSAEKPNFDKVSKKVFEHKLLEWLKANFYSEEITSYSRADYLLDCIISTNNINVDEIIDPKIKGRVLFFRAIRHLVLKIFSEVKEYNKRNKLYYYIETDLKNYSTEDLNYISDIEKFINSDELINKVFGFHRVLNNKTTDKKIKSIIRALKSDFLMLDTTKNKSRIKIGNQKVSITKVIGFKYFPNKRALNFFDTRIDWEQIKKNRIELVGEHEYQKMQNEIDEIIKKLIN
ncbi:DEAD/DEAH box helicase family protein [Tenacibaculum singaporense]|uniref:Restriction endonuclease subunit R n=1 Tax=Tenacibaculum singaporense TaxID=2358479 RepID=A0A3Q8RQJ2_9FLAO|nr:DEAD/DEAH box helicase family protein [Tenacibaculum singaporense]AZJ36872.1 restriction endonuclease subunit R [Tenacibaculum singaporense]